MVGIRQARVMRRWKRIALDGAEVFDAWRVIPRVVLGWIFSINIDVAAWVTKLAAKDVNASVVAIVASYVGGLTTAYVFYLRSGRQWGRRRGPPMPALIDPSGKLGKDEDHGST